MFTALLHLKEKKKKKGQRWVFLEYSGLSSAFLNDSVVSGFRLPLLHTAGSGGGERVCVWNISEPTQGL